MNADAIADSLAALHPGAWELYEKTADSREVVSAASSRSERDRSEVGFAARWWDPAPRFAAGSSPAELRRAIEAAGETRAATGPVPEWPGKLPDAGGAEPVPDVPEGSVPDAFEELARLVAAESRGQARLEELTVRRGRCRERVRNAGGRDVAWTTRRLDGRAKAVGRLGSRACEARIVFRWDSAPDLSDLARRLADRATLPLSESGSPFARGEWVLDPAVGAALLGALAPIFLADVPPRWAVRGGLFPPAVSIVDDATADAPFDGEGVRTRRVTLLEAGALGTRLRDLSSPGPSTGHGVRHSYRTPPARSARRLFFEAERPLAARDLLASVKRGLFAAALTAPWRCDLERDLFEAEFTGIAVMAGRAQGSVAGARARGRLSDLLRRLTAISSDRRFFPIPDLVGSPTLRVERVSFE